MKGFFLLVGLFSLLGCPFKGFSQRFATGLTSGLNFSHIHGELTSGKWESQTGPAINMFFQYKLSRIFSLQTELDYTALYYQYKGYRGSPYGIYPCSMNHRDYFYFPYSCYDPCNIYNSIYTSSGWVNYDFNFFRIPLFIKFTFPTDFHFELGAGGFISFLQNSDYSATGRYPEVPAYDNGLAFSTGISFPLNDRFSFCVNGRYFYGLREYIETIKGKNGSAELVFGISYSPFSGNDNQIRHQNRSDNNRPIIYLGYTGGLNISSIREKEHPGSYSARIGYTAGISFRFLLGEYFSLHTDILLERKGYYFDDTSNSYIRYIPDELLENHVRTCIDLDYVVIPILLNLSFGTDFSFYLESGPYAGLNLNARSIGTVRSEFRSETSYLSQKIYVFDHIDGYIKDFDWGWITGCGIRFPVYDKYLLDVSISYDLGLMNIYSTPEFINMGNKNDEFSIKNKSFSLKTCIVIPLF